MSWPLSPVKGPRHPHLSARVLTRVVRQAHTAVLPNITPGGTGSAGKFTAPMAQRRADPQTTTLPAVSRHRRHGIRRTAIRTTRPHPLRARVRRRNLGSITSHQAATGFPEADPPGPCRVSVMLQDRSTCPLSREVRTQSINSRCSGATGRMYTSAMDELAA